MAIAPESYRYLYVVSSNISHVETGNNDTSSTQFQAYVGSGTSWWDAVWFYVVVTVIPVSA